MDTRKLRKLSKSKSLIAGIYNYCDRWCERCAFAGRCMVYAMEEEQCGEGGKSGRKRADYWADVENSLHLAVQMLKEMAAERGIDLDEKGEDEGLAAIARHDEDMRQHPLARRAEEYAGLVEAWFKDHQEIVERKQEELQSIHAAGVPGRTPLHDAEEIDDAFQVIGWYQYQIGIKLMRALSTEPEIDEEAAATDSAGSAKVALIAIDRSLIAWTRLREHFSEEEDRILDTLVLLDRLRRAMESEFPNARKFKRPGFDD